MDWITDHLGSDPEVAEVAQEYYSPDEGRALIKRYGRVLGPEGDRHYIGQVQTGIEDSVYILWPEEMYEMLVEGSGYITSEM